MYIHKDYVHNEVLCTYFVYVTILFTKNDFLKLPPIFTYEKLLSKTIETRKDAVELELKKKNETQTSKSECATCRQNKTKIKKSVERHASTLNFGMNYA